MMFCGYQNYTFYLLRKAWVWASFYFDDDLQTSSTMPRVMQLEVGRENAGAIKFYQRNRFEKIGDVEKCGGQFRYSSFRYGKGFIQMSDVLKMRLATQSDISAIRALLADDHLGKTREVEGVRKV